MRTHEATDGRTETEVEFCFDPLYWAMYNCYSTTYPNGSAKHAWRAGFREGVKMCLDQGRKPSVGEFKDRVYQRNLDHLTIWHNVGRDVEYGKYAILGARQGTYMTMLTDWDHTQVQWFDALEELYLNQIDENSLEEDCATVGSALQTQLDLPILEMDSANSAFFKQHYRSNWHNREPMIREIDVIRGLEGW
jgi:hypothetical protein